MKHRLRRAAGAVMIAGMCFGRGTSVAGAQGVGEGAPSADTSLVADLTRYIGALSADSFRDRLTPSHALDQTAEYLAAQLRALGFQPGDSREGGERQWLQRYPLPRQHRVNTLKSSMTLSNRLHAADGRWIATESGDQTSRNIVLHDFQFPTTVPWPTVPVFAHNLDRPGVVILAGRQTSESVRRAQLHGEIVLYVPSPELERDTAAQEALVRLLGTVSRPVILSPADSATFASASMPNATGGPEVYLAEQYELGPMPFGPDRWPFALAIPGQAIHDLLEMERLDLARLRADTLPVVRKLPSISIWIQFDAEAAPADSEARAVPNVVGVLEGTDSVLKNEYVLITAPMDVEMGRGSVAASASAPAGLLALARAFSEPVARPRRSLILLATSGGIPGEASLGSSYFARMSRIPRPGRIVAALALDRLEGTSDTLASGSVEDTILVDGLADVAGVRPDWIAAAHPDLRLRVANGETVARRDAIAFPFVFGGIPSLSFHTEARDQRPRRNDLGASIDVTRLASRLRFVFYVGQTMANADQHPQWSAEGRRQLIPWIGSSSR